MNTPTDKEVRDWYMGYGVEGRAELAKEEGIAFDRYLLERDAKVAKATEERIIKLLNEQSTCFHKTGVITVAGIDDVICNCDGIALIKGEK